MSSWTPRAPHSTALPRLPELSRTATGQTSGLLQSPPSSTRSRGRGKRFVRHIPGYMAADDHTFCYECNSRGHFPRDCPVVQAKDADLHKRILALPENQPKPLSFLEMEQVKRIKPRKLVMPLEVPDVPKESQVKAGDLFLGKMLNTSALFRAVYNGDAGEVLRHVKRGADVAEYDSTGLSPLHVAAMHGHHLCVSALLSVGANANIIEREHRRTPLMLAAMFGHSNTIKVLLLGGADPTITCDSGETAVDSCRGSHAKYLIEEFWRSKHIPEY